MIFYRYLRTFFAWILTAVSFSLHMFLVLILSPIPSQDKEWRSMRLAIAISGIGMRLLGIQIHVQGRENLPEGPFILVANHQSYLDILVMMQAINKKIAFVAKEELLNVPILGWDIRAQGHVAINRDKGMQAARNLKELAQKVYTGKSLLLFPEGTRSLDGRVGEFKRGAFQLALDSRVPIVPACLSGSGKCMPKKSKHVYPGRITVTFLPPILPESLVGTDKEKTVFLSNTIRETIIHTLGESNA